jgi:hypothetical protein
VVEYTSYLESPLVTVVVMLQKNRCQAIQVSRQSVNSLKATSKVPVALLFYSLHLRQAQDSPQ